MSASALIARFGKHVTLTRFSAGTYSDGNFIDGSSTTSSIIMSCQPLNGRELLYLPEGQRTRQYLKAYTASEVRTTSQETSAKADQITYNGKQYEVQQVEYWESTGNSIQPYYKVLLAEMNP
jgi:hypothetical protein